MKLYSWVLKTRKEKHTTQPEMGHFKKAGVAPKRYFG